MTRPLSGWKEIAEHLGKSIRTIQRWEDELKIPVRRPPNSVKGTVIAYPEELDRWLQQTWNKDGNGNLPRSGSPDPQNGSPDLTPQLMRLRERRKQMRELSATLTKRSRELRLASQELRKMARKGDGHISSNSTALSSPKNRSESTPKDRSIAGR